MSELLTVSGLNMYVRMMLESDVHLKRIRLRGELSNLTDHYRSGHIYMTLKDERSAVKAVMFAGSAKGLRFRPQDGMKVVIEGRVTLYEVTGSYQLIIDEMMPEGIGELTVAFEQLKAKLQKEGLFDTEHKKMLPLYPKRIGVITSPTGAAVQDILPILKRRYPIGEIVFQPVTVQGENAAPELTAAIKDFDRYGLADVIIIGRGGGSIEDLWAFNDEGLARAIYDCRIPVVSAVGHETDFTICDFVSDVRASTPSAGAELVSPEMEAMESNLLYSRQKLLAAMIKNDSIRIDEELIGLLNDEKPETTERILELLQNEIRVGMVSGVNITDVTFSLTLAGTDHSSDLPTYVRLMGELMNRAKAAGFVSAKRIDPAEGEMKYYVNSFLNQLGFGGPDHKNDRKVLMGHIKGYAAFKNGAQMEKHKARLKDRRQAARQTASADSKDGDAQ